MSGEYWSESEDSLNPPDIDYDDYDDIDDDDDDDDIDDIDDDDDDEALEDWDEYEAAEEDGTDKAPIEDACVMDVDFEVTKRQENDL